jgi:hypothetical protein
MVTRRGKNPPAEAEEYEDPEDEAAGTPESTAPGTGENGDFEPEDPGEEDAGPEMEDAAASGAAPTDELRQLHAEVEKALFAKAPPEEGVFAAQGALQGSDNIVGVGIGSAEVDLDQVSDEGPAAPVLNVYVAEPTSMDGVRASVVDSLGVRALSSERVPINVICTGVVDALAHRHRERPSPNGISVGHLRITAGTQGCLARGRSGPRRNRVLLLSNNHVLANSNAGNIGDSILQPGPADGGQHPRDRIAILEKFVNIRFDGRPNFVDCATGWTWHRRVRRDFIYRSGGQWRYFQVSSQPRACQQGLLVGKSGRTTQLTVGRITDCNASIRVNFGNGRVANFRDQITIRGVRGDFSRGGDSGSLIWTWNRTRNPVGLLFAGGGGYTFANKIHHVLRALDINLYT